MPNRDFSRVPRTRHALACGDARRSGGEAGEARFELGRHCIGLNLDRPRRALQVSRLQLPGDLARGSAAVGPHGSDSAAASPATRPQGILVSTVDPRLRRQARSRAGSWPRLAASRHDHVTSAPGGARAGPTLGGVWRRVPAAGARPPAWRATSETPLWRRRGRGCSRA